jgi:hypothetical protein
VTAISCQLREGWAANPNGNARTVIYFWAGSSGDRLLSVQLRRRGSDDSRLAVLLRGSLIIFFA